MSLPVLASMQTEVLFLGLGSRRGERGRSEVRVISSV